MNFLCKRKNVNQQWISLRFKFGNYKTKWILWAIPRSWMILKRQTVLGYPTLPVILWVFRVVVECLATILACSLTHGTCVVHWETLFKDLPAPNEPTAHCFGNARSLAGTRCVLVSLHTGRLAGNAEEWERKTLQYLHRDLKGSFQLGIPRMQKELIRRIAWLNNRGSRSRICISNEFPNLSTFQCSKTEVCFCSNFLTEALLCIGRICGRS